MSYFSPPALFIHNSKYHSIICLPNNLEIGAGTRSDIDFVLFPFIYGDNCMG